MPYVFEEALEAAASLKPVAGKPVVGIILGSGFGPFAQQLRNAVTVPYTRIPNFPPARVEGHAGQLIFADLDGVHIAVLAGRVHYYEGYDLDTVTRPVRTLALLGVTGLIVTNAAGGIRDDLQPGDLMAVEDHINLLGANPLRGPWDPRLGPRYPDMTHAYHPKVRQALHDGAREAGVDLKDGVYAAMGGPSYETPAEIRMLARMGADAVGMSTVPEVIAANQMGMKVAAVSCIANRAAGLSGGQLSHKEVMEVTQASAPRFIKLFMAAIPKVAAAVGKLKARPDPKKEERESMQRKRSVGAAMKKEARKR